MPQSNRPLEIGTGLFVVLGFAALAFLTTQLPGSGLHLSGAGQNYNVTAEFDDIGGLKVGAPVTMAGVRIGEVDTIAIDPTDYRAVVTLGRVPLFYFLLQWYVIHGLAVMAGVVRGLPVAWLFSPAALGPPPEGWPLSLPGIYAAWAVVLAVLYIPCRWFAGVKARHPGGWLSYL